MFLNLKTRNEGTLARTNLLQNRAFVSSRQECPAGKLLKRKSFLRACQMCAEDCNHVQPLPDRFEGFHSNL